ncbi:MAG: gliding motility-associated C-terminal domain-containing protein [Bacteroidetes bacterium]|nr:gliding motility-associated C-terminal domain-containing protein [Bacteroidota bacterium]
MVSNTVNVTQYTTPVLSTNGANAICNNSPVQLQVICDPSATIQWQSPLSGNGTHPIVYQPGVYQVLVTQCNITIPLSITVRLSNPVAAIATNDSLNFCSGDSIRLFSATPAQAYLWLPGGQNSNSIYVTQAGQYVLQTTDSFNCVAVDTIACTTSANNLNAPLASDTTICNGESVILQASGQAQLIWMNSNLQYVHSGSIYQIPGLSQSSYYLVYSDSGNCKSAVDTAWVMVENCDSLPIPNILTVNGDNANDIFPNFGENGILYSIQIFNRWGKRIYHSIDSYTQWSGLDDDGNRLSDGTYYYILSLIHATGRKQEAHGWVMVVNGK